MKHELKIWPANYARVADGTLNFQVRDNDREFQAGDVVVLREWDPKPQQASDQKIPRGYTGSKDLEFKIGFVLVLDRSQVVFSLIKKGRG